MNNYHESTLHVKYPKIFADKDKPPTESLACFGLECQSGWFTLVDVLCKSIQNRIDNPPWKPGSGFISFFKKAWNITIYNKIIYPICHRLLIHNNSAYNGIRWKIWGAVMHNLACRIESYECKGSIPQVVVFQVKEKFGGLRFYYDGGDEYINAQISFAEAMSYHICECCGSTANVTQSNSFWIRTRCEECHKNQNG